jgi:outer membrane protein OmpA-like peptidoglycan-associated protein
MFGGRHDQLLSAISAHTGGSVRGSSRIMGFVLPLVMGAVGKHAMSSGLDSVGLGRFLGDQKSSAMGMLPGPLRSFFGHTHTREPIVGEVEPRHVYGGPRIAPVRRAHKRNVLPWVIGALVVLLLIGWMLNRISRRHLVTGRAVPTQPRAVPPPESPSANAPAGERQPVGGSVSVIEISQFLASHPVGPKRFALGGVTFATGTSALDPAAGPAVDRLAAVLKEHPDATLRVEGFADATGSPSSFQRLSSERADALKQQLVARGVAADRIDAVGLGARAQQRAVEVVVTPGAR